LWSFFLIVLALPVAAQDLITSRSYLADPANQAALSDIKQQALTPYEGFFNGGFSQGTFWIRIELAPSSQELILKVKPPQIDNIDVYVQEQLLYSVQNTGYRTSNPSEVTALPYAFL
jgi:hypothetical protein